MARIDAARGWLSSSGAAGSDVCWFLVVYEQLPGKPLCAASRVTAVKA